MGIIRMLFLTIILCIASPVIGQNTTPFFKADIYFFSIGSYQYYKDFSKFNPGFSNFQSFSDVNSAERFSSLLESIGACGQTIVSKNNNLLRKKDVLKAFKNFIEYLPDPKIVKSINDSTKSARLPSVLFVYFFGHGYLDTLNHHFLILGDFNLDYSNVYNSPLFSNYSLTHSDLNLIIKESKKELNVVYVFDCCSERSFSNLDYYKYDSARKKIPYGYDMKGAFWRQLSNVADSYFPNPTIIAAYPGKFVQPVNDPSSLDNEFLIGPLCRRLIISSELNKGTVSIFKVFTDLFSKDLDNSTSIPYERAFSAMNGLWQHMIWRY